jgi:hypothetical protein
MTDTEQIHQFCQQNLLVERYLLGELKGMDLEDFELHMLECAICHESVLAGDAVKQALAAGVTAPRKSLWRDIREFFSKPREGKR